MSSIQEEGPGELISFILFKAVNTCLHAEVRDSPDIYAKGLENVPPGNSGSIYICKAVA